MQMIHTIHVTVLVGIKPFTLIARVMPICILMQKTLLSEISIGLKLVVTVLGKWKTIIKGNRITTCKRIAIGTFVEREVIYELML